MTDTIIALPATDAAWQPDPELPGYLPQPPSSVEIARYNDGVDKVAYLSIDGVDWPPSSYVVGVWDSDTGLQLGQAFDDQGDVQGTPLFPLQSDYDQHIARLGNRNGKATGHLDTHRWQGHVEEKFMENDRRYPLIHLPITIRVERTFRTDGPLGNNWGFLATVLSQDPARAIEARRMTVYTDDTYSSAAYSTGAFEEVDGEFVSFTPSGLLTPNPDPIYFALNTGSVDEGRWELIDPAEGAVVERLFWEADANGP